VYKATKFYAESSTRDYLSVTFTGKWSKLDGNRRSLYTQDYATANKMQQCRVI